MEEDGLSFVDAVENSPVAVGPEGQHVVFQGEPLGQRLGPVAGPRHQIRAGVLGDVCGDQFAGVQAGEAEAESSTPTGVNTRQAKTYLELKMDLKPPSYSQDSQNFGSFTPFYKRENTQPRHRGCQPLE